MTAIPQDILEAIEKSLPAFQIEALRNALNEAEETKAKVESLTIEAERRSEEYMQAIHELATQRSRADGYAETITSLQSQVDALSAEVRDAEIAGLRASLEATNSTTDKFLKNTIYRESLQHQVVNEYPTFSTQTVNGYSQQVQTGTNKQHVPVTDIKEQSSE